MIYTDGFIVPPISRRRLRALAKLMRQDQGIALEASFPIVRFLECMLPKRDPAFRIEVVEPCLLADGEHARTTCMNEEIIIEVRSDVYKGACENRGRDRFTLTHELGHYLLHGRFLSGASRCCTLQSVKEYIQIEGEEPCSYRNSEWQAEAFAGELLMPADIIQYLDESAIVERFGVSSGVASRQKGLLIKEIQRKAEREKVLSASPHAL